MVSVRLWAQTDIRYVTESVNREGWGYTLQDIERCWRYEPNGCFLAEIQHKPVGHVFSIGYGKMGWIGLLIVNPEKRGKGIGTILMQTAINYLQKAAAETIRLEAAEKAVSLYKRLGFEEEFVSLRFSKQLKQEEMEKPKRNKVAKIFRIQEKDVEGIAQFDAPFFGANRLRVLQSLYIDQPQHCLVAKEKQKTLGYIMSRKISNTHRIGPWVCQNLEIAEKLMVKYISTIKEDTELRLGMPILNKDGIKLMKKLGFQLTHKSLRMFWGKHNHKGDPTGIYGIGGPEKG